MGFLTAIKSRLFSEQEIPVDNATILNISDIKGYEPEEILLDEREVKVLAELKEEALNKRLSFSEEELGNQSLQDFSGSYFSIREAIENTPTVNCLAHTLAMAEDMIPSIDLGFGDIEKKAIDFEVSRTELILDESHMLEKPRKVYGEDDIPEMPHEQSHGWQPPQKLETEEPKFSEKLGLRLSRTFKKASNAVSTVTENAPGFLSRAWDAACENKGKIATSAAIGLGASILTPWMAVAAPIVAVASEVRNKGFRNIEGNVDYKRLATVGALSSIGLVGGYGIGEVVQGLGMENWFSSNTTPTTESIVDATPSTELAAEEIEALSNIELVSPVDTISPSYDTLVSQVDLSAAEAAGWNLDWAQSILENADASDEARAQALKDMAFAASYDGNIALQEQLLEAAAELDPSNTQVTNDLSYINS